MKENFEGVEYNICFVSKLTWVEEWKWIDYDAGKVGWNVKKYEDNTNRILKKHQDKENEKSFELASIEFVQLEINICRDLI